MMIFDESVTRAGGVQRKAIVCTIVTIVILATLGIRVGGLPRSNPGRASHHQAVDSASGNGGEDHSPVMVVHSASQAHEHPVDVVVVGAGISGLSAALELGVHGVRVTVIDIASIFGGHAVMSQGDLAIVDTPMQRAAGIRDSPELARSDFHNWGGEPDAYWVDYYTKHSQREIYDWLIDLGVAFESVLPATGNSVPRVHEPVGRGLGLVAPIYRKCVDLPNVEFMWNTRAVQLIQEDTDVVGVRVHNERTQIESEIRARRVVLATGGFQNNLDMVRASWPTQFRFPDKILVGSGVNSIGLGHHMAQELGAELVHMDRQWNYFTGIPDLRYPGTNRGLNAANMYGILVNANGRRFANLLRWTKEVMPAFLQQPQATAWFIFDSATKEHLVVSGSDWGAFSKVESQILQNPELVVQANSLEQLANRAGLPSEQLVDTMTRYNAMVDAGVDQDFGRFGPDDALGRAMSPKISQPPFYAMRTYPLTRKSMGGVAIDAACRVLDRRQQPISGLYAVGELTGLALINGKSALEGTFLGPCIVTGRVAARHIVGELVPVPNDDTLARTSSAICLECHDVQKQVAEPRTGYWHFEKVHAAAIADNATHCVDCHAELSPFQDDRHRIDPRNLAKTCGRCHLGRE
ncbi:MAG: FAD-dependent oxidoreductase [Planctomycetota bacterium]|nr:FAD-dependent oxidoreductase [Planctomycetota bacterium]MDA1177812.1 FAD-dependent oxidoreductase [Planctomycetota bacterium]